MKSGEGGGEIGRVRKDGGEVVAGAGARSGPGGLRSLCARLPGGTEAADAAVAGVSSRTAEERLHPVLYFELHLFENLFFILLFRGGKVECA